MRLVQNLQYLLPIAGDDNETPRADEAGEQTGEAQKLDEAAGGLPIADEVEVSTETNADNPDNDDDEGEEDDKEADEEADEEVEDPEWHEETAVQVFVD